MDLSIVIPAFREAAKIWRDVEAAGAFLAKTGMTGEIIVVDDGSDDGTAEQARIAQVPRRVRREVIRYEANRGKGYAIRTGVAATSGKNVMFADSGLCIIFDYALQGLALLAEGRCELAHATRRSPQSDIRVDQPIHRRAGSKAFRWLIHFMGVPPKITDSQCGFKVYRGDVARELYAECITDGFMFDVEIILRAVRKGYRICEFPVQWYSDPDTRLRAVRTAFGMLGELWAIRQALKEERKK